MDQINLLPNIKEIKKKQAPWIYKEFLNPQINKTQFLRKNVLEIDIFHISRNGLHSMNLLTVKVPRKLLPNHRGIQSN